MGLTLNEQETWVCDGRREWFDLLGYTFGPMRYRKDGLGYTGAGPAEQAVQRVKGASGRFSIRATTRRGTRRRRSSIACCAGGHTTSVTVPGSWPTGQRITASMSERGRHKVSSQGTRPFPIAVIYGELGVFQCRRFPLTSPAHARV